LLSVIGKSDNLKAMELRHLRYFSAVAEEKSFTRAARRLHISQSGISGQVRDLEKELGVTLLHRDQRSVSLTPEGAIFLREAQEILAHAQHAMDTVVRASQGHFGKLTVGLCGPATAPFLPRLIREFRKAQPGIALSLKDLNPANQPQALIDGEIDIGFTRSVPSEFRATLRSEAFFSEPIVAVLPRGHSLEREEAISLIQLASERFVLYARENAPELFDAIVVLCRRAKFSPRVADTPTVWQSVLTMVEAGEGVSLVPACVRHLCAEGVVFRPLRNRSSEIDVVLAWRNDDPDPIRDGFLTLLRQHRREIVRQMARV
jgi:DNA-binding transcriptional LysR family regulator